MAASPKPRKGPRKEKGGSEIHCRPDEYSALISAWSKRFVATQLAMRANDVI